MRLRIMGLIAVIMFTAVSTPAGSWAQIIAIDFGPGICTLQGTSSLTIATATTPYVCGNISISPRSSASGNARVEAVDGGADVLRFVNATITANQPVSDFHIVTSREFSPGPTTAAGLIYYRTTVTGAFSSAVGNTLTLKSTVTDVLSSTTEQMYLGQASDNDADGPSISLPMPAGTPNTKWIGSLTGNRILKIDYWFTLANSLDKFSIDPIMMQNRANAGGAGEGLPGGGTPAGDGGGVGGGARQE